MKEIESINPSMEWYKPQMNEAQLNNEFVVMPDPDKMWDLQWDIRQVTNDGKSYELGMGSHNVIVGIIDSGIDRDHADLVENIVSGSKNFVPTGGFQGTEPYESGNINDFDDLVGHGTHCAGTIAANGKMKGVAPNVGIRAYRVFGGGNAETIWITKALVEAANDGVDVISMSLGDYSIKGNAFYTDPETGKKEKLDNFVADITAYKRAVKYVQEKGSIIVASTGNDALNMASKKNVTNFMNELYEGTGISFTGAGFDLPSTFSGVITVSATGPQKELASYSSYGAGIIDVAAPGGDVDLYLEYMMNGQLDKYFEEELHYQEFCLSTSKDGYYSMGVGTSMATTKVSAVVALLIDKYGKLSPNQIEQLLKNKLLNPLREMIKNFLVADILMHLVHYKMKIRRLTIVL